MGHFHVLISIHGCPRGRYTHHQSYQVRYLGTAVNPSIQTFQRDATKWFNFVVSATCILGHNILYRPMAIEPAVCSASRYGVYWGF